MSVSSGALVVKVGWLRVGWRRFVIKCCGCTVIGEQLSKLTTADRTKHRLIGICITTTAIPQCDARIIANLDTVDDLLLVGWARMVGFGRCDDLFNNVKVTSVFGAVNDSTYDKGMSQRQGYVPDNGESE